MTEKDFSFSKDGSTRQKLDVLERMMGLKKNGDDDWGFYRPGTEIVFGESGRQCMWLCGICKRPQYGIQCAEYAFEKGHQGRDGIPGSEGICGYL